MMSAHLRKLYQSHHLPSSIMKRLIVCCDGTWYSADKGLENIPSNVAQISRMIAPYGKDTETGKRVEQIVYYQTGVGSGPMGKIDSAWQGNSDKSEKV